MVRLFKFYLLKLLIILYENKFNPNWRHNNSHNAFSIIYLFIYLTATFTSMGDTRVPFY